MGWMKDLLVKLGVVKPVQKPKRKYVRKAPGTSKPRTKKATVEPSHGILRGKVDPLTEFPSTGLNKPNGLAGIFSAEPAEVLRRNGLADTVTNRYPFSGKDTDAEDHYEPRN